jgi:hypothetical protein
MAKYGNLHRIVDFVSRTIPNKGMGQFKDLFVHPVMNLLKSLDAAQEENQLITLSIGTGGGIWLRYNGERLFLLWPAKGGFVRLILPDGERPKIKPLIRALRTAEAKRHVTVTVEKTSRHRWRVWRVTSDAFPVIERFIKDLPKPSSAKIGDPSHPRFFPGNVRQAALEDFERNGSICAGVDGQRKAHKLKSERIEFDHIAPHSRRGASSLSNIQVLCQECNNLKRATAG